MPRKKKEAPNRSDERFEVKITIGTRPDGSLIRKSFYSKISKADAQRQAKEWEINHKAGELSSGQIVAPDVKFKILAAEFLRLKESDSDLREFSYITTYESAMKNYVIPYFGDSLVRQIKPIDIENFFAQYSNLSKSMHNKFKLCLRGVFELAISNDIILKSPVPKRIKSHGKKERIKQTYTFEDRMRIMKYCKEHNIITPILLLELGIRRSELLGLTWDDIDIENECISINKSVTPTRHSYAVLDTKTETSRRVIPCSTELIDILKHNKGKGYIYKGRDGKPMAPTTFAHRYKSDMTKICAELGIQYLPPHNLRHTVGTLMHAGGTDIYTISKYLGHSDIGITSKIYVKTNVESLRKNIKI